MEAFGVALISRTFFYVPFWLAQRRGFFAAAGLDVNGSVLDSADLATNALRSGTVRFAIGPPEGVIEDVERGGTLRIVAGNTSRLVHDLIARPRFRRVEDLRGGTIGCVSLNEGSTFHFRELAAAHGLHYPGDYTFAPVGGAPTRWKHLQAGSIDAGLQSIPLTYIAEDAGFTNLGKITRYIPQYQFATTNADLRWIEGHTAETDAFLAALRRATKFMYEDREAAVAVAAEEMELPRRYVERAWLDFTTGSVMPIDLSITRAGLKKNIDLLERSGTIAPNPLRTIDRYLAQCAVLA